MCAAQPLAAIAWPRATRSLPRVWALRARAPAAVFSPPRATRTAPKAWELRARALLHVAPPPPLMRALPLGCGDVEDVVRFTLLETLVARRASRSCRGRGWGGVVQTSSCASVRGNACVLPPHVQCASARSAAGIGAPSPQARPIPRTLSAPARRAMGGACAFKRPAKDLVVVVVVVVVRAPTSNYLRLASPVRGSIVMYSCILYSAVYTLNIAV